MVMAGLKKLIHSTVITYMFIFLCYLITQFPSLIYVPCDKLEQEYLA